MAAGDVQGAWNLMHPVTRSDVYHGSQVEFATDVLGAEWDGFEWEVALPHFHDVHYIADLHFPNGWQSMPDFLADRRLIDESLVNGETVPYVVVRIDEPFGGAGILSNGPGTDQPVP